MPKDHRHHARELVLHALYEMDVGGHDPSAALTRLLDEDRLPREAAALAEAAARLDRAALAAGGAVTRALAREALAGWDGFGGAPEGAHSAPAGEGGGLVAKASPACPDPPALL